MKQPQNTTVKPLITKDKNKLSFYEVGGGLVMPSLQGIYGRLLQDDETAVSGAELRQKIAESNVIAQIFMCCLTAAAYFLHLRKLDATRDELLEFNGGVRAGLAGVEINGEKLFDDTQIEYWIQFYITYSNEVAEESQNTDSDSFNALGSISSRNFMDKLYEAYGVSYKTDEPVFIAERMQAQLFIDTQIVSTLSTLSEQLFRDS